MDQPAQKSRVSISTVSRILPRWSMSTIARTKSKIIQEPRANRKFWLRKYHFAVYFIFAATLIMVISYLSIIGSHMASPLMYLEGYDLAKRWLEYNSYSLLSPFATVPLVLILCYHVKKEKKLVDGDFFGILAIFVLLGGISIHDGSMLYEKHNFIIDLMKMPTKPNAVRDITDLKNAFSNEIRVVAGNAFKEIPIWLHEFQHENECCGVQGYMDWVHFMTNKTLKEEPYSCCCKRGKECTEKTVCKVTSKPTNLKKRGCIRPIWKYLKKAYGDAYICMFTMAAMELLCIVAYTTHWLAMRQLHPEEEEGDTHPFALAGEKLERKASNIRPLAGAIRTRYSVIQEIDRANFEYDSTSLHSNSDPNNTADKTGKRKNTAGSAPPPEEKKTETSFFGRLFGGTPPPPPKPKETNAKDNP